MRKRIKYCIVLLCCTGTILQASQRIFVRGAEPRILEGLAGDGCLEILNYKPGRGVDCIADDGTMESIRRSGYGIEILIPDMEGYLQRKLSARKYDFGQYYTYAEMVEGLNGLHDRYPTITSLESIGQSHQGREIWALKINQRYGHNDLPSVMFTGVHHGCEPIGCSICMGLSEYFCQNYGRDSLVTWLVNNRNLWFVPVFNPDGYVFNESYPSGTWRKNRRDNGGGEYGVDLNRNYPYRWGYNDIGSSPDSSEITYRGPGPGSEPEIRAVMNLAVREGSFATGIHYHAPTGNSFGHAWSYAHDFNPDSALFYDLAQEIITLCGYYYEHGVGPNGDARDWFYGEQTLKPKCFAYMVEVGNEFWEGVSDTGIIVQRFGQNLPVALAIAQAAGPFVGLADKPVIGAGNGNGRLDPGETEELLVNLKNRSLETGAENVRAVLSSDDPYLEILQPAADYGSLAPRQAKTNQSQPFSVRCDSACPGGYIAALKLRYQTDQGRFLADTFRLEIGSAPADVILDDDCEGGAGGWSHGGNNDLWHLSARDSRTPSHSWYSGLEGTGQYRDTMDCRLATGIIHATRFNKLEFWTRYDLEPGYDLGYAEISTNGGADWQQIGPAYTGNSGWNRQSLDLSAYYGTLNIAFRLYSDISVHDYEGWYLDDVRVTGTSDTNLAPDRPASVLPNRDTVDVSRPLLSVDRCLDPNGNRVHYGFRVYSDSLLCHLAAGTDSSVTDTVWQVSPPLLQGRYWWRAYADDGRLRGLYSPSRTFYNTNGITPVPQQTPSGYRLKPSYPNPAGRLAVIPYQVPQKGPLEIKIYNVTGQLVRSLFAGTQGPGDHFLYWDLRNDEGKSVLSGIYICRLSSVGYYGFQKITVIRSGKSIGGRP